MGLLVQSQRAYRIWILMLKGRNAEMQMTKTRMIIMNDQNENDVGSANMQIVHMHL